MASVLISISFVIVTPATAIQGPIPAEGRVVRVVGADTSGVAGVRVILHRVGRETQGPVDSTLSASAGRFRFRFRPDTTSLYLLSARFAGIEYFSPPVHTNPARPDTAIAVVVSDTSSTVPIVVESRHLVVSAPTEDGTRNVLDLVTLRNDGSATRIAPDSNSPTWAMGLPATTIGFAVGQGGFSPEAVTRRGDSLIVFAPIAPGEKQLVAQYSLAAGQAALRVPAGQAIDVVNVLLEETEARVAGGTLAFADSQVVGGRVYQRWTGSVPANAVLQISLPRPAAVDRWLLAGLVGVVALTLAVATWFFLLRSEPRPAVAQSGALALPLPSSVPASLVDAAAALDAAYLGREAEVPEEEWERYRAERARLLAQLDAALAGPP